MNTEFFISRARMVHGDKYDYSQTVYLNRKTKLIIICKNCLLTFSQRPDSHLRGANCQKCAKIVQNQSMRSTTDEFIAKAKQVHKNKFDYSNTKYINNSQKVSVKCLKCQFSFLVTAHHHLDGSGCPNCAKTNLRERYLLTVDEFITKAKFIHGDKYDYTTVVYGGRAGRIQIKCNGCNGHFTQIANNHLTGSGCPKCVKQAADLTKTKPLNEVIKDCQKHFGEHFDYSKIAYVNCSEKITVICKQCKKEHRAYIHNHRTNGACPYCGISKGHRQIVNYIQSITNSNVSINNRELIAPYELDIYLPDNKLAIEFHGLYRHSFAEIPSRDIVNRHQTKALLCEKAEIRLLQFWSSEWEQQQILIQSMIRHHLRCSNRIYARSCEIIKISDKFFISNHIQGMRSSSVTYGLSHNGIIVAGMSFCKHHKYEYEIIRYANILNHTIVGGASKLFAYFVKTHQPTQVLSYADYRFSTGNVYKSLGFEQLKTTKPNYFYTDKRATKLWSRQSFQKHKLAKKLATFDPTKSEIENCLINDLRILYDAGHTKWLWKRS